MTGHNFQNLERWIDLYYFYIVFISPRCFELAGVPKNLPWNRNISPLSRSMMNSMHFSVQGVLEIFLFFRKRVSILKWPFTISEKLQGTLMATCFHPWYKFSSLQDVSCRTYEKLGNKSHNFYLSSFEQRVLVFF